jgi:protein-tyrosine kinase
MGIIEKAVDQFSDSKKDLAGSPPEAVSVAARETSRQRKSARQSTDEYTVVTSQVARIGPSAEEDNPALSQDFKFLKRPLLARVFGRSGDATSGGHLVLVTSDLPGAGKSFVSVNLAASIAQEQMMNVILIDADPLRRNLTVALGQEDRPGLLELLVDSDVEPASMTLKTDVPSLRFLPAGQPLDNSTELLASKRLIEIMDALDDPDTLVLLDSPPVLVTAEARVLAERIKHTVVVVEAGRTTVSDVASVLKMLDEVNSSISFVLNKAPTSGSGRQAGYYHYGHQYGY